MIDKKIEKAAQIINNGGLVAFPTETVYGLGANALNPIAVAKIFQIKERPSFDPLIVHIASLDELNKITKNVNINVFRLAEKFWPGPLTIVLPKSKMIPDIVTSGLSTVGIRMPNHEIALKLILTANCPIAAPSANKFGQLSPVCAKHVKKQLPNVDFILDGGNAHIGIESTIISLDDNVCTLLRPGIITIADIEKAIPNIFTYNIEKPEKLNFPGQLKSHYSPSKPLYILKKNEIQLPEFSALILHGENVLVFNARKIVYTSKSYNYLEIAANLFSALHTMEDDASIKQIFIEPVKETGLGIAIMDRVKKAAFTYQTNN